jgi:hypothetical protein
MRSSMLPNSNPLGRPLTMLRPQSHPQVMRALCAIVAAAAAGYLWATSFGDGIHGLKDTAALDNSNSFPDANVAMIVALVAYGFSPFFAARWSNLPFSTGALLKWFAGTALAGAALFAASRVFV